MICSLAPVWNQHARVLILGSMPGAASLRQQQYYAHPQNAFWPIITGLLGAAPDLDYHQRLDLLRRRGIALWDVLEFCEREGSLDSDIRRASESPNAIVQLLATLDAPRAIALNGRKAQTSFERFVGADVRARWPALEVLAMPSTSPAHASLRRLDKQAVWSRILTHLDMPSEGNCSDGKEKGRREKGDAILDRNA